MFVKLQCDNVCFICELKGIEKEWFVLCNNILLIFSILFRDKERKWHFSLILARLLLLENKKVPLLFCIKADV